MSKRILIVLVILGLSSVALGATESNPVALTNKNAATADTSAPGLIPEPCPAPETFVPGIYLGLSAGYGMTNWDLVDGSSAVNIVNGNNPTILDVSGTSNFAGRVYAGYDFHKNFALEVGYSQFFNNTDVKFADNNKEAFNPAYDWAIDAVAKIKAHIVDNFGFYAKVGVDYLSISEGVDGKGHDTINLVYGAGAFYDFTPHFSVDVAWMRFNGDSKLDSDDYIPYHDLFSAGVAYKFNLG
jgi:hypothetical protein